MEETVPYQIKIERPLYDQEQLRKDFDYQEVKSNFLKKYVCDHEECKLKKCVLNTLPIVKWLPEYNWKKDLMSDIISGFTVAIMHIPQGMAYALLGNVPAIIGIYMAFFPVLVYTVLGTSRHNSMGTFAVVCLMTGKAVLEHSDASFFSHNDDAALNISAANMTSGSGYSPIQVATAVTFAVAIFQILMYLLQLGAVSVILSDTLISGFTTGAAIQVLMSQIKDILGIRIPRHTGYFSIIHVIKSICMEINNINLTSAIISAITILTCTLNNLLLKPFAAKYTSFPVPIELIVIVFGTVASTTLNLHQSYNIKTVGEIPTGLPPFTPPPFELIPSVILDGFTIAIVSYTITLSMGLIFAQKLNYELNANQELLAQGVGNVVGSMFSCMPVSASLSRSSIQQTVGGKTQITSVVSCCLLLSVLLWVGPFFEPLPKSILASVILIALKGLLVQVTDLFVFWKLSKMDALIWLSTFLTVIFIGIDIGLLVGVIVSLFSIFLLGFKPYTCLLGQVPHTDLFLDINKYKKAMELPGMKIFHYCGGINFATRNQFTGQLYKLIKMDPQKEMINRDKIARLSEKIENGYLLENKEAVKTIQNIKSKVNTSLKSLILDFSSVSYIDPSGVGMLQLVMDNFNKLDIPVCITGCSDPVYNMMKKCNLFNKNHVKVFPTVSDAALSETSALKASNSNVSTISRL